MAFDDNIRVRKLSNDFMEFGFELTKGEALAAPLIRRFWENVLTDVAKLINKEEEAEKRVQPKKGYVRKGRRRLTDDDVIKWKNSQYYGHRLGDIPDDFWRWFLRQDWCDRWPELVEYANHVVSDETEDV